MRTDELVSALRRTAFIGDAAAFTDWTDALLQMELNDKLQSVFNDIVTKARAGYWLKDRVVTATANLSRYRIPPRAVVGGLEKVEWSPVGTLGTWSRLTQVPASIEQQYRASATGTPSLYTIEGDVVDLIPAPQSGFLRLSYYIRPSKLVTQQSASPGTVRGLISNVNTLARTVTVNALPFDMSLAVPAAISGTPLLDIVHPDGWHELSYVGDAVASIAGLVLTLSGTSDMSDIAVGDFVRSAEQTDWPCLPDDFHRALADISAVKVMLALGMTEKSASVQQNVANDMTRFQSLLQPRVKAEPKQIGIVRRGRGGGSPYWRW